MEIIRFYRPDENTKNLLVLNLPSLPEDIIYNYIFGIFSKFGLIYEIQILKNFDFKVSVYKPITVGFKAYVKFYSSQSAANAKSSLENNLIFNDSVLKILFANRKTVPMNIILYQTKCYDLANYYLGFNKWSIKDVKFSMETTNSDTELMVTSNCRIELHLISEKISSFGSAIVKHPFQNQYPESKSIAYCLSRKRSYQKAVEDAFSKVVLVIYNNKTYADICAQRNEEYIDEKNILTVNEIEAFDYSSDGEDNALDALLLAAQQTDILLDAADNVQESVVSTEAGDKI